MDAHLKRNLNKICYNMSSSTYVGNNLLLATRKDADTLQTDLGEFFAWSRMFKSWIALSTGKIAIQLISIRETSFRMDGDLSGG